MLVVHIPPGMAGFRAVEGAAVTGLTGFAASYRYKKKKKKKRECEWFNNERMTRESGGGGKRIPLGFPVTI
jgi:hypothetical protein